MRLNRLRVDPREKRMDLTAKLHILDSALLEDVCQHIASRAIHAVNGKLEVGLCDLVQIGKLADGFNVRGLEICFLNLGRFALRHGSVVHIPFNLLDDGRSGGAAISGLELHSSPMDCGWK